MIQSIHLHISAFFWYDFLLNMRTSRVFPLWHSWQGIFVHGLAWGFKGSKLWSFRFGRWFVGGRRVERGSGVRAVLLVERTRVGWRCRGCWWGVCIGVYRRRRLALHPLVSAAAAAASTAASAAFEAATGALSPAADTARDAQNDGEDYEGADDYHDDDGPSGEV